MATIKSYTDISQSMKLAEILPLESADMHYPMLYNRGIDGGGKNLSDFPSTIKPIVIEDVSCWSLASLLAVLPEIQGGKPVIALDDNYITYPHMSDLHTKADNLVDACYELILKLNELNLL